jgi:hypothetical protein
VAAWPTPTPGPFRRIQVVAHGSPRGLAPIPILECSCRQFYALARVNPSESTSAGVEPAAARRARRHRPRTPGRPGRWRPVGRDRPTAGSSGTPRDPRGQTGDQPPPTPVRRPVGRPAPRPPARGAAPGRSSAGVKATTRGPTRVGRGLVAAGPRELAHTMRRAEPTGPWLTQGSHSGRDVCPGQLGCSGRCAIRTHGDPEATTAFEAAGWESSLFVFAQCFRRSKSLSTAMTIAAGVQKRPGLPVASGTGVVREASPRGVRGATPPSVIVNLTVSRSGDGPQVPRRGTCKGVRAGSVGWGRR